MEGGGKYDGGRAGGYEGGRKVRGREEGTREGRRVRGRAGGYEGGEEGAREGGGYEGGQEGIKEERRVQKKGERRVKYQNSYCSVVFTTHVATCCSLR